VWPGGLCLSRSLGDFDVGTCVLALPHICQARRPLVPAAEGQRLRQMAARGSYHIVIHACPSELSSVCSLKRDLRSCSRRCPPARVLHVSVHCKQQQIRLERLCEESRRRGSAADAGVPGAQVRVPATGGRVLVASDGVWDAFAKPERVARMSRSWHTEARIVASVCCGLPGARCRAGSGVRRQCGVHGRSTPNMRPLSGGAAAGDADGALTPTLAPPQETPGKLVAAIRRAHGGLKDDTSVIVLDLLPPERTWPAIASPPAAPRKAAACFCFAPCAPGPSREQRAAVSAVSKYLRTDVGAIALAEHAEEEGGVSVRNPDTVKMLWAGFELRVRLARDVACPRMRRQVDDGPSVHALAPAEVLADLDVAMVVGLMGAPAPAVPGWCTPAAADALRRSQARRPPRPVACPVHLRLARRRERSAGAPLLH